MKFLAGYSGILTLGAFVGPEDVAPGPGVRADGRYRHDSPRGEPSQSDPHC